MVDPLDRVRESTKRVMTRTKTPSTPASRGDDTKWVTLGSSEIFTEVAQQFVTQQGTDTEEGKWDENGWHFTDDVDAQGTLTCQYIFVLDALNFCFWPSTTGLEYEELASSLTKQLREDNSAFDAENLCRITEDTLRHWFHPHDLPNLPERVRKVQELGYLLKNEYQGLALNLVFDGANSASKLVQLITAKLPGFRDEAVYYGDQIFFYKRAQILVADLWAAFGRQTSLLSEDRKPKTAREALSLPDINRLTMFPDYRVPQVLVSLKLIKYHDELREQIRKQQELPAGSPQEIEIRAATIQAVEKLREELESQGISKTSVELDWLLWQRGENAKDEFFPHHRTRTCFY